MKKHSVTIVGWINKGKPADCGETMKNQLLIKKLEELGVNCRQIDFKNWKRRPWVLAQFAITFFLHQSDTLILSSSPINMRKPVKIFRLLGIKRNIVHWVIGGSFADNVNNKTMSARDFSYARHTIVESERMRQTLLGCGFKNVLTLPNFKPISYYPQLHKKAAPMRFVFLSRIMPEKGCDYILNAAKKLEENGYRGRFTIDFYGKIDDSYKTSFLSRVSAIESTNYKGFLNLRENQGYDKLSEYDVMLFPTYWKGEGFAGVFVDSFIAGVPMIASDWAHNCEFLENEKTALIIPTHDEAALTDKMAECIDGKYDLSRMSSACQMQAECYNVDNLINEALLRRIEIIR